MIETLQDNKPESPNRRTFIIKLATAMGAAALGACSEPQPRLVTSNNPSPNPRAGTFTPDALASDLTRIKETTNADARATADTATPNPDVTEPVDIGPTPDEVTPNPDVTEPVDIEPTPDEVTLDPDVTEPVDIEPTPDEVTLDPDVATAPDNSPAPDTATPPKDVEMPAPTLSVTGEGFDLDPNSVNLATFYIEIPEGTTVDIQSVEINIATNNWGEGWGGINIQLAEVTEGTSIPLTELVQATTVPISLSFNSLGLNGKTGTLELRLIKTANYLYPPKPASADASITFEITELGFTSTDDTTELDITGATAESLFTG